MFIKHIIISIYGADYSDNCRSMVKFLNDELLNDDFKSKEVMDMLTCHLKCLFNNQMQKRLLLTHL